jgi:hypothetical protein
MRKMLIAYIAQITHKVHSSLTAPNLSNITHLDAAPINMPFSGPNRLTKSNPKLLPQTTGPEPAEYSFCSLSTTPSMALFFPHLSEL